MPLLKDVFDWCVEVNEKLSNTEREIRLMLDIKTDNEPSYLMKKIWSECQKERQNIDSKNITKYWKSKIILGLWNSKFYDPEISSYFTVINITFDVKIAKKFYKEIKEKDPRANLHAVSMINLILYNDKNREELIEWAITENVKLWFWTVNDYTELCKISDLCSLPNGKSLLEGVVTDDAVRLFDKKVSSDSSNWIYNLRCYFKSKVYSIVVFLLRGGYNIRPLFNFLKFIGFI